MAADSTLPVQSAVRALLIADPALTALIGNRVYDYAPDEARHPYVSFGAADLVFEEAQDLELAEVTFQLDTWSRKPGRVEARQIMAAISDVLHRAVFTISGHSLVLCRLTLQTDQGNPDGVTTHGIQQFTITTQRSD